MSIDLEIIGGRRLPALWREVCDKCGTRMELKGFGHGFERWACPYCHQVVGIDRDPQVGGYVQLHRGHPWRWAAQRFTT